MKFSVAEIEEVTGAEVIHSEDKSETFSICTDSRVITQEDIYLPLKGERFDGHSFINNVVESGCRGYFVDKNHVPADYKNADFVLRVDDTLSAYLKIASFWKDKVHPFTIGITGSSGKTTVKEMVASVLSNKAKTRKSLLNHNNEIGLCQTLLSLDGDEKFLVVEMGMRGLGEIDLLAKYARPDIAVINNIGTAHIGRLGSVENIAKAKCEITNYLSKDGLLIACENEFVRKYSKTENIVFYGSKSYDILSMDEDSVEFEYKGRKYKLNVTGEYNVLNAIAAIEVGVACGLGYEEIAGGLMEYIPIEKRGSRVALKNGALLINDCYNANPDSMKASLSTFLSTYNSRKKVLVLGDMGELGEHEEFYHREVGRLIKNYDVDYLVVIGELSRFTAEEACVENTKCFSAGDIDDVVSFLKNIVDKDSVVLFKASRVMKLEEIIKKLVEE